METRNLLDVDVLRKKQQLKDIENSERGKLDEITKDMTQLDKQYKSIESIYRIENKNAKVYREKMEQEVKALEKLVSDAHGMKRTIEVRLKI